MSGRERVELCLLSGDELDERPHCRIGLGLKRDEELRRIEPL